MPTRKNVAPSKTTAKAAAPRKAAAKKAVAKKVAARGQPVKAANGISDETLSTIDALTKLQTDLEAVRRKLRNVDDTELDDEDKLARNEQLRSVSAAIEVTQNALLSQIADAFESELPNLQSSTAKLAASLAKLNEAARVINAVAGVLGVIQRIVTLGS